MCAYRRNSRAGLSSLREEPVDVLVVISANGDVLCSASAASPFRLRTISSQILSRSAGARRTRMLTSPREERSRSHDGTLGDDGI